MLKYLLVTITFLLCSPVLANEERKFDFSVTLKDEHGVTYSECVKQSADKSSCVELRDITLGALVLSALNASGGDQAAQIATFKTIQAIASGAPLELSATDVKRIIDALWAYRQKLMDRGGIVPLYEFGEAVKLIDPASLR